MSDSVKNIVAGLKDDPSEAALTPASATQKPRKARRAKTVEVVASRVQRTARRP